MINTDEQLEQWVAGNPIHAANCCPDFSCCRPELLASQVIRKAYLAAGEDERIQFLGYFLGEAISLAAKEQEKKINVRVLTDSTSNDS
jgi:hypothetical protein